MADLACVISNSRNEIFSYNLELPNEEGTRLSAEFVAFLKDEGGDYGPVD
ncbi:MAG: hypothetical protein PUA78_03145 [Porphyromonadaceae bacterium]|nr:hypothetical protein [Porphyromonadaceae bacterium]MDD6313998.1 hypothetical protein [Porphyromonadaceae bacterium]